MKQLSRRLTAKIQVIIICAACLLALAGCSASDTASDGRADAGVVGTWELSYLYDPSAFDVKLDFTDSKVKEEYGTTRLIFKQDGSGKHIAVSPEGEQTEYDAEWEQTGDNTYTFTSYRYYEALDEKRVWMSYSFELKDGELLSTVDTSQGEDTAVKEEKYIKIK